MFPIEPVFIVSALLVVFVAAIAQGTLGLGFGQISAAGLIWIEPLLVPTTVILMAFVVGSIGALRDRAEIQFPMLSIAVAGRIAGTLLAIPLLLQVGGNSMGFDILFGVLILVAVVLSLVKSDFSLTSHSLLFGGLASGLMGTITSVGAPPIGLVFQGEVAARARPTLNAFFAIGAPISLLVLFFVGRFSFEHLIYACILAPGFISGVYLSKYFHKYVDNRFRYIILGFSAFSAVALIGRALI